MTVRYYEIKVVEINKNWRRRKDLVYYGCNLTAEKLLSVIKRKITKADLA